MKKGKTEYMLFGTQQRLKRLPQTPPIKVAHRFVSVNFTDSYKYLGLFLTNTLNMSSHIKKSMKTASSRLNLLKRVRYFIDSHTASTIYRSMIIPTMTYCPLVTSSSFTLTQLAHLARLENRAKKIIGNEDLPSVENIHLKRIVTFVFKCLTNDVCENFDNYFHLSSRSSTRLVHLPKVKLELAKKAFYFNGGKCFNSLSRSVRNANNLAHFKRILNA